MAVPETETTAPAAATVTISDENRAGLVERLKFFFSDANLRQDNYMRRFLWNHAGNNGNNNKDKGAVPLDALLRFKTIQQHTTSAVVLTEVTKTDVSDLLVVTPQGITRKVPFTRDLMQANRPVSLYLKELPIDTTTNRFLVTQDQIRQAFSAFPGLVLIKLCFKHVNPSNGSTPNGNRKNVRRVANGSALVEFETVEQLQAAAGKTLTFRDGQVVTPEVVITFPDSSKEEKPVTVMLLQEFSDLKEQEKKNGSPDKKRKTDDSVVAATNEPAPEQVFKLDWVPGCVIRIEGLAEGCDREAILKSIGETLDWADTEKDAKAKTVYVDYSRGQPHGHIRFTTTPAPTENIKTVFSKLQDKSATIAGAAVETARLLEGEEETTYYKNFIDFKTKQMAEKRSNKRSRKS